MYSTCLTGILKHNRVQQNSAGCYSLQWQRCEMYLRVSKQNVWKTWEFCRMVCAVVATLGFVSMKSGQWPLACARARVTKLLSFTIIHLAKHCRPADEKSRYNGQPNIQHIWSQYSAEWLGGCCWVGAAVDAVQKCPGLHRKKALVFWEIIQINESFLHLSLLNWMWYSSCKLSTW